MAADGGGVVGFGWAGGMADDGGGGVGFGWVPAGGLDSISVGLDSISVGFVCAGGFVWATAAVCNAKALATTAARPRTARLAFGGLEEGMRRFKHSSAERPAISFRA
jgi:hypothetical protein